MPRVYGYYSANGGLLGEYATTRPINHHPITQGYGYCYYIVVKCDYGTNTYMITSEHQRDHKLRESFIKEMKGPEEFRVSVMGIHDKK